MALITSTENLIEPHGDVDPNTVYAAVGQAIHAWESLESAVARLYLAFAGIPEGLDKLAAYGAANRRFVSRMAATRSTALVYFSKNPDQEMEGRLARLLEQTEELSIERHRIAHGHIVPIAIVEVPANADGSFVVEAQAQYRWAVPFYSLQNLRAQPSGLASRDINLRRDQFMAQHIAIHEFTAALAPRS